MVVTWQACQVRCGTYTYTITARSAPKGAWKCKLWQTDQPTGPIDRSNNKHRDVRVHREVAHQISPVIFYVKVFTWIQDWTVKGFFFCCIHQEGLKVNGCCYSWGAPTGVSKCNLSALLWNDRPTNQTTNKRTWVPYSLPDRTLIMHVWN